MHTKWIYKYIPKRSFRYFSHPIPSRPPFPLYPLSTFVIKTREQKIFKSTSRILAVSVLQKRKHVLASARLVARRTCGRMRLHVIYPRISTSSRCHRESSLHAEQVFSSPTEFKSFARPWLVNTPFEPVSSRFSTIQIFIFCFEKKMVTQKSLEKKLQEISHASGSNTKNLIIVASERFLVNYLPSMIFIFWKYFEPQIFRSKSWRI